MREENRQVPQQLGQYLYQQIKEPWSEARLVLDYHDDNMPRCSAFYYDTSTPKQAHVIPVSDEISVLFLSLFENATSNQEENWQKAIFSVKRSGQFSLNFETADNEEP
ncbi:hypothetical protein [Pseudoalteromonas sp. NJ631]|uniref:hypothetical protein n=2 Tax=Pseudoalteromonas TaxID=53246 RepID=UPI0002D38041|nr:hypothetical protein [Pseudoalteromonas sp. NJ631]